MKIPQIITAAWFTGVLAIVPAAEVSETPQIKGTIAVQDDSKAVLSLARIPIEHALEAAAKVVTGKVVKAELDEEDGFLVWEVEVISPNSGKTELLLDAGDGSVLRTKRSGVN